MNLCRRALRRVPWMTLLLAAPFAGGCARPWVDLAPEEAVKVGADRARLIVVVPERRIYLVEQLYKVLWNEIKENSYSYEGVWDPSPWLEEEIARALRSRWAIDASPLRKEMDPATHEDFSNRAGKALTEALKENRGIPYITSPADESVRALRKEGAEYLFQAYLVRIIVSRHAFSGTRIVVILAGRIIRLSDGAIVWFREASGSAPVPKLHSFSDLEKDDLSRLKQCFGTAMAALLGPEGDLLRELGPARPAEK